MQHIRKGFANICFAFISWRHIIFRTRNRLNIGKLCSIDFSIYRLRHTIHPQHYGGNHILREMVLHKSGDILYHRIGARSRREVPCQIIRFSGMAQNLYRTGLHLRKFSHHFLDFIQLNAEATQFYLIVNTSMNTDSPLLCPRGQVPAMIGAQTIASKKGLGRLVWQIDIATPDTITADNQFTLFAYRKKFALLVDDIEFCIHHRPADHNFPFIFHKSRRATHGAFRWSIDI